MPQKITLELAFQWVCPACGTHNFDKGEDINETEMYPPEFVTCYYCSSTYEARYE